MTPRRARLWWGVAFVGLFGCIASWAVAMPVASAPDEPAHVYRAVSLWRGEFLPERQADDGAWILEVPTGTEHAMSRLDCAKFDARMPARCPLSEAVADSTATVSSGAGRYLPVYYLAVGWPSLISSGEPGILGMRLVSGLFCALLMLWAISFLRGVLSPRTLAPATILAITPQVVWLSSVVNPNAWEMSAGLLVWAVGLSYVAGPRRGSVSPRNSKAAFVVGVVTLLAMRRLGPLWLALIVASLALVWMCLPEDRRAAAPISRQALRLNAAWIGGLCALSVGWHQFVELGPALSALSADSEVERASMVARAQELFPDFWQWLRQFYGVTGWLDTRSPVLAMIVWLLALGALFVTATHRCAHRRGLVSLLALGIAGTFVIPMALAVVMAPTVGLHAWQGRYQMPYTLGLIWALAVIAVAWRAHRISRREPRTPHLVLALCLAAAGASTFANALHRYADGEGQPWDLWSPVWSPPLGVVGSILVACASYGLLMIGLLQADPPRSLWAPGVEPPSSSRDRADIRETSVAALGAADD